MDWIRTEEERTKRLREIAEKQKLTADSKTEKIEQPPAEVAETASCTAQKIDAETV